MIFLGVIEGGSDHIFAKVGSLLHKSFFHCSFLMLTLQNITIAFLYKGAAETEYV
jgi:hypothetical protein